jgi:hypothetical protein
MVLWSTKEWAAWPQGLSKAAARMMCDPLVFYTVLPPFVMLGMNGAWPHRVSHQSHRDRIRYILCRLVMVPLAIAGICILGSNRTRVLVSLLHECSFL